MGTRTVANLKNTNRTFDNVLDSYLNLTDGGTVAGASKFSAATTFDSDVRVNKFDLGAQVAQAYQSDGTADSGVAGETNQWNFRCGNTLSAVAIGDNQTLLGPALATTGLNVSGDATDNDGWELRGKSSLSLGKLNKDYFTVGTSPAFYAQVKCSVADISDVDKMVVGFAKDETFTATVANYNDLATIGILDNAGDIKTDTIVGNATNVTTDLTAPANSGVWADGAVHTMRVNVSAAGVVTYLLDGVAPTGAVAYTFTDGLNVTPYWYHIHVAASTAGIIWQEFEFGLQ
jgi:hypothetical protein